MGSFAFITLVTVGTLVLELVCGQDTSFAFKSFNCQNDTRLQCTGDSKSTGAGQLNLTGVWSGSKGRALYLPAIRLLDPGTSKTFSFSTNFTFSMHEISYARAGEGLAFVLLSNPDFVGAGGGFLGVYGPDGRAGTRTLAVEFDSFKDVQYGNFMFNDINGNHVGVDVESINSKVQVDAGSSGIVFSKEARVTAWVDYSAAATNGNSAGNLQVRISRTSSRPSAPLLNYDIDLSKIFTEYMYVGFSAATGDSCYSYNNILDWGFCSWFVPPPPYPGAPPPGEPPTAPGNGPLPPLVPPPPPPPPGGPIYPPWPAPRPIIPVSPPNAPGPGGISPGPGGPSPGPGGPSPGPGNNGPYSPPGGHDPHKMIKIVVPIVGGLAVLSACCLAMGCCWKKHRHHPPPPPPPPRPHDC